MKDFSNNSENQKINEECIENPDILNNLQDRTVEQNTVQDLKKGTSQISELNEALVIKAGAATKETQDFSLDLQPEYFNE